MQRFEYQKQANLTQLYVEIMEAIPDLAGSYSYTEVIPGDGGSATGTFNDLKLRVHGINGNLVVIVPDGQLRQPIDEIVAAHEPLTPEEWVNERSA